MVPVNHAFASAPVKGRSSQKPSRMLIVSRFPIPALLVSRHRHRAPWNSNGSLSLTYSAARPGSATGSKSSPSIASLSMSSRIHECAASSIVAGCPVFWSAFSNRRHGIEVPSISRP